MVNPPILWFANVAAMAGGSAALLLWVPAPVPPDVVPVPPPPTTIVAPTTFATPVTIATTRPTTVDPPQPPVARRIGLTFFVADTQSFRGKDEDWHRILQRLAHDPALVAKLGNPPVRIVDAEGVRPWNGLDSLPPKRTQFKNNEWNAILQALGRATAAPECGDRVIWLIENSSHPDKLSSKDQLLPTDALVPSDVFAHKRLTLIWNGHADDSKELRKRYSAGDARRLMATRGVLPQETLPRSVVEELKAVP